MGTRISRKIKDEQGASAVEFALVLPILLLLIFGIIEFGLLYHDYLAVTHAAREGARMAAVGKYDPAIIAQRAGLPAGSLTIVRGYPTGSKMTGDPVEVSVSYPHPFLTGYLPALLFNGQKTVTVKGVADMCLEQPAP